MGVTLSPSKGDVGGALTLVLLRAQCDRKNPAILKSYESWFRQKCVKAFAHHGWTLLTMTPYALYKIGHQKRQGCHPELVEGWCAGTAK